MKIRRCEVLNSECCMRVCYLVAVTITDEKLCGPSLDVGVSWVGGFSAFLSEVRLGLGLRGRGGTRAR